MDILLLNILISNHLKFITKRFFLLNRNTPEISHARDWEWVSRLRRSSLLCSRVPFCPFFELKDVIPRYARSRETIFRALLLKRNRGKGVL